MQRGKIKPVEVIAELKGSGTLAAAARREGKGVRRERVSGTFFWRPKKGTGNLYGSQSRVEAIFLAMAGALQYVPVFYLALRRG
jgi:hypothetical protein